MEAYASGCAVLTTGQSGIRDVFADGVNGFEIRERSAEAISSVIEEVVHRKSELLAISLLNRETAGHRYRATGYTSSLRGVFESRDGEVVPAPAPPDHLEVLST